MTALISDIDTVLTTTRAVRKRLDFDRPVSDEVIEECLSLAQQATMGSNQEDWRFVAVRDPALKRDLAELYRDVWKQTVEVPLQSGEAATVARLAPDVRDDPTEQDRQQRVLDSVKYLVDRLEQVPVIVFACSSKPPPTEPLGHRTSGYYGSIFPIVWSFQLALRSRGLGSVLATAAVFHADEIARLLALPADTQPIAMVPVAHTVGLDFKPATRLAVGEILRWDRWNGDSGRQGADESSQ